MRLLADVHISHTTVQYLNRLGHDAIRATSVLPAAAPDDDIVAKAIELGRAVLTQDLDFSDIVALSGKAEPSLITLRLSDSRVENVNRVLGSVLPTLEERSGPTHHCNCGGQPS
jgi:predicted nuclease of predicted toxin-antitoxin system